MTSEERAQETFRGIATEAVNDIMDALDTLGDFAPLHKNEMYGPEVDECFNAIAEYLERTKKKYEPDKKRQRFIFASQKAKQDDLKPISEILLEREKSAENRPVERESNTNKAPAAEGARGGARIPQKCVVYTEAWEKVGTYNSLQEASRALYLNFSSIYRAFKQGTTYKGYRFVKAVE